MTSTQKIVIQGQILPIPTLFRDSCNYCNSVAFAGSDHESEIMRKARKLCRNPNNHFPDVVYSCLDFLDHAHCTPTEQFHTLTTIHDAIGCNCLEPLVTDISTRLSPTPHHLPDTDIPDIPNQPNTSHTSDTTTQTDNPDPTGTYSDNPHHSTSDSPHHANAASDKPHHATSDKSSDNPRPACSDIPNPDLTIPDMPNPPNPLQFAQKLHSLHS